MQISPSSFVLSVRKIFLSMNFTNKLKKINCWITTNIVIEIKYRVLY